MSMSGDVTTQNLSLGGPAVLVALINAQNLIYLPTPLTVAAATFNDPYPYGGDGANTVITVGTNAPATYGAGTVNVHYTRADLSTLPAIQPPLSGSGLTVASVLSALNTAYGLDLAQANITQTVTTPLTANPDGSYTQQITTVGNDMLYAGTQIFTFQVIAPVLTASFTSSATYLAATFTDTSTDVGGTIHAWAWTFGDGGTATTQNPTHTYTANGTYTVVLTITDANGTSTDVISQPITVAAQLPTVTAAFTQTSSGYKATFTDASTDVNGTIASWAWTFGDGNSSTAQNPTHVYASAGNYTAQLTVTDANGITQSTVSHLFAISAPVVTANYTSAVSHLSVAFTDTSTDVGGTIASWLWNFGDGNTATTQNPTHVYGAGGTYSVELTVTDADGHTANSYTTDVTSVAPSVTASFTSGYGANHLDAVFTDTSTDLGGTITAWAWTFGDGGTSTLQNPTHTYASGGSYTVTLTVTGASGETAPAASETFIASSAVLAANFTDVATELQVAFTDTSTVTGGTIASWAWNFGDTNTATAQNPSHTYSAAGTYTVTLEVTDSTGVVTSTKSTPITVTVPVLAANFTSVPNKLAVAFTDTSTDTNGTIHAWAWNFGDGTGTSTVKNPSYTYTANGTYTVELTITDLDGTHTATKSIPITVSGAVVTASYTFAPTALEVAFTDTSTVTGGTITSWHWNFGDGTGISATESPTYTYASAGTYSVTLTATDATGDVSNTNTQSVTVS